VAKAFEFQVNVGPITAAVEKAFLEANLLMGRNAAKEITDDKWYWPSAPSPRDAKDLGGLLGSYTPEAISPTEYEHAWTVDYAMAVHEGAVRGGGSLPGRPWTREPLEKLPKDFEKIAKTNLGGVK
jgi:hypothetical protein